MAKQTETPEAQEEADETTRGMDTEILTMSRICRLMEKVDDPAAQGRIINWLSGRYPVRYPGLAVTTGGVPK